MRGYSLNFRDSALYEAYKQLLSEGYSGSIYQKLINSPAPSFFASERLAITYVHTKELGHPIPKLGSYNREKYEEIYRRYLIKKKARPHLAVRDIIRNIIISPAPRFYMSAVAAQKVILKIRHDKRRKQAKASKI